MLIFRPVSDGVGPPNGGDQIVRVWTWTTTAVGLGALTTTVAIVGSETWIAAGYRSVPSAAINKPDVVARDEREWLRPAVAETTALDIDPSLRLRLTALLPATSSGGAYEIVRVVPLPPIPGEPLLLLVSARDGDAPDKLHRLIVEADNLRTGPVAKSL
jgi:hypothetical protein